MGMSTGGSGKGAKSEFNITPLIDVVLVLLIIFMVTMPIKMKRITVEVPRKINDDEVVASTTKQITITVREDGNIGFSDGIDEKSFAESELASTLRPILDSMTDIKIVFLDADQDVPWFRVVAAMDTLRSLTSNPGDKDQIKVAIKVKEPVPGAAPQ